jgi:hypothetical protein
MAEKTTKKSLRERVTAAVHRFSFFGKVEDIADHRRHVFNERVQKAKTNFEIADKRVRTILQRKGTVQEVEDAEQLSALAQMAWKKALSKREFWRNRYVWAHERHAHWGTVLKHRRDRLRRFIQQHDGFQPYMANGHPYEKLTPEARYAIYLDFRGGNYVTATYEGFPGDGVHATSSYHYIQNQPDGRARCWDAGAGTRGPMAKAQLREAERCASFLIEMFGPENDFAYKNGVRFTLPEGSELETMHDNHKHTCIRDGAPTK